jgi:hypothetical protein
MSVCGRLGDNSRAYAKLWSILLPSFSEQASKHAETSWYDGVGRLSKAFYEVDSDKESDTALIDMQATSWLVGNLGV